VHKSAGFIITAALKPVGMERLSKETSVVYAYALLKPSFPRKSKPVYITFTWVAFIACG
jgi:hypothetical protein